MKKNTLQMAQKPTEGKWFEVKPQTIEPGMFDKKRNDTKQEKTCQLIREAFAQMEKNPTKYGKNFKTTMPKNTWLSKTVAELKEMASELGERNADWVEQALEWAQRIVNGEPWECICNDADSDNWYRLVIWKNGGVKIIGGSVNCNDDNPASHVGSSSYDDNNILGNVVPKVVLYE